MSAENTAPIDAQFGVVEAHIRARDLAAAAAALEHLRAAAPSDARVCLLEAALARLGRNVDGEIAALGRGLALAPRWLPAQIELAKALARAERFDEAVAAADRAAEIAPDDLGVREVAVALANQAGNYEAAERHLRVAGTLRPTDAAIARGLATCLYNQKRYEEAEPWYRRVCDARPNDPAALGGLGVCLLELHRNDEAVACLQRALAHSPDDAGLQFHLAIARGDTPRTQPNELTARMFDGYSPRFDRHLVGDLKYRVPKRVAEIVRARHPEKKIDVLDLGCGTGLTGVYLGKVEGSLAGVDLSKGMIERARRHGVYTHLAQGDLRDALRDARPEAYDYVIANDVFIYVGDIGDVIPAAFKILRGGGALVFSCETAAESEGDFVLRPSKRYAHSRGYVERLCAGAGFSDATFEYLDLRTENGVPLAGFIVVAQKA